jgi:tankyrase
MTITPLSAVCSRRDPDAGVQCREIEALLKAGADVNATDKNGVTALHHAVRFRNAVAVETLLEHGAAVNQACRRSGATPLHRAVTASGAPRTAGKQIEARQIIDILLRYGADPTIKNHRGLQPADYTHDEELRQRLARR